MYLELIDEQSTALVLNKIFVQNNEQALIDLVRTIVRFQFKDNILDVIRNRAAITPNHVGADLLLVTLLINTLAPSVYSEIPSHKTSNDTAICANMLRSLRLRHRNTNLMSLLNMLFGISLASGIFKATNKDFDNDTTVTHDAEQDNVTSPSQDARASMEIPAGDADKAAYFLRLAIAADPNNDEALYRLSYLYGYGQIKKIDKNDFPRGAVPADGVDQAVSLMERANAIYSTAIYADRLKRLKGQVATYDEKEGPSGGSHKKLLVNYIKRLMANDDVVKKEDREFDSHHIHIDQTKNKNDEMLTIYIGNIIELPSSSKEEKKINVVKSCESALMCLARSMRLANFKVETLLRLMANESGGELFREESFGIECKKDDYLAFLKLIAQTMKYEDQVKAGRSLWVAPGASAAAAAASTRAFSTAEERLGNHHAV